MKKLLFFLFTSLLVTSLSFGQSQTWQFDHLLYDAHLPQSNSWGVHGVAVDPDGKVWIALHGDLAQDTLFTPNGDTLNLRPIYVLDPATGEHVSFSPIRFIELPDGTVDTLGVTPATGSGKGISVDNDGNILFTSYSTVYRIDYKTGQGLNKFTPDDVSSMTEAVQSVDGKIYAGYVLGGARPVMILDNDFNFIGNAIDTLGHITRTMEISDNGQDLYVGSTWNGFGIEHWHSDLPGIVPFAAVDTFGNWYNVYDPVGDSIVPEVKLWSSCLDWGPDGYLWAGNLRPDWSGIKGGMWYVFDVNTKEQVDSVGIPLGDSSAGGVYSPRGAAWSNDGKTMYLADYDYNIVGVWKRVGTGIEETGEGIPTEYKLSQNYPNPFNPTTVINFSIPEAGDVTLKIYDMLGREVATLVNESKQAGSYRVTFDASKLSSGVYMYTLKSGNFVASKKMMLMK